VCGKEIKPNPELGDRQGGKRQIVHMATTWDIFLCEDCVKPIFDLYHAHKEEVHVRGTVVGSEAFKYLPRDPEGGAVPKPMFSAGE